MVRYANRIRTSHEPKKPAPQSGGPSPARVQSEPSMDAELHELEAKATRLDNERTEIESDIERLKADKRRLKEQRKRTKDKAEREDLKQQEELIDDKIREKKTAKKANDKERRKTKKALRRLDRGRHKTRGRTEAQQAEEITAEVAVRRMRGITCVGTGQECVLGRQVSSEARWVYYCLKIWGDVSTSPSGTPNAQGVSVAYDAAKFPGEYVTRTVYCKKHNEAKGKFDKATRSITFCLHKSKVGTGYVLYCSSLVCTFLGFYYAFDAYKPEYAYWTIDAICEHDTLDWSKRGMSHFGIEPNPFRAQLELAKTVKASRGMHDVHTQIEEFIAAEQSRAPKAAPTKHLGNIYIYSRNHGSHTGLLAWYRGRVWKLAADGDGCNTDKGITCGPYSETASKPDMKDPVKLYRAKACDERKPPLNLFLEGKEGHKVEHEQKSALKTR